MDASRALGSILIFVDFRFQIAGNLGEFNDPTDVTLDQNGRILVSDSGNHRIQVRSGKFSGFFI